MDLRRRQDIMVYPRAEPVGGSPPISVQYPRAEGDRAFWQQDLGQLFRPKIQATLSLSRSRYGIGQMIDGTLAVEETAGTTIRGVEFTLEAEEEARARGQTDRLRREAARLSAPWPSYAGEGATIPFTLETPAGLVPTLARPHFHLAWSVRARLDIALAVDVSLAAPITIVLGDGT
jgi:hypothetical protein